jgi:hypothetical protein
MAESLKRKRGAQDFVPIEGKSSNVKPARVCSTGKDVKAAIELGSKDGKLTRHIIPDRWIALISLEISSHCGSRKAAPSCVFATGHDFLDSSQCRNHSAISGTFTQMR